MHLSSRVSIRRRLALALAVLLAAGAAQADSYTYSGRLDEFGTPVTGRYDLRLAVHADAIHGSTVVTPITFSGVEVVDGAFRVDFDLPPGHDQAWVELSIRPAGSVDWVALPGRTQALLAPAAIGQCWSTTGDASSNPATNFIGTTDAQAFTVRTANAPSLRIEPSSLTFGSPALPITTNTIGGSHANTVTSGVRGATIAGGGLPPDDVADPDFFGDAPNRVTDHYGTVGGGFDNRAGDALGTVADRAFATVSGGVGNTASNRFSTVGGGQFNTAGGLASNVSGGQLNSASGDQSTVGGGRTNTASGLSSTIGGGEGNQAGGGSATVSGGRSNTAGAADSSVGGGDSNTASGSRSTVGGGLNNTASGEESTVGGGEGNTASGILSTVGGGGNNTASLTYSTVSGGLSNTASGLWSTVSGGFFNCAGGELSWAGGRRAKVRPASAPPGDFGPCNGLPSYPGGDGDRGTFVWADRQSADFVSTGENQFLVRAAGGAVFTGNSAVNNPLGNRLRVDGLLRVDTLGTAAATTLCRNASNQISSCSSSARYKSDIADLELGLATALRLHAVGYRWKNTGAADVGFVAEEIAAIDERLITRNDQGEVEGVKYERLTAVLANAVQELAARDSVAAEDLARVSAENAVLRSAQDRLADENAALRSESAALRSRLAAIEARLGLATDEER